MKRVVLALGSNEGDRAGFLEKSCELIGCRVGKVTRCSRVYETEAWGFEAPPFLNQAIIVETELSPDEVLHVTQQIEKKLGRTCKSGRTSEGNPIYHNRTIDIDILLYEGVACETPQLTLPHPHISERDFVLLPLSDLFGDTVVPPFHQSFQQMLNKLKTEN
jgi:2-amino-4-hydroxy-6-hydroxymethyldihydropteridine diphosphokinase